MWIAMTSLLNYPFKAICRSSFMDTWVIRSGYFFLFSSSCKPVSTVKIRNNNEKLPSLSKVLQITLKVPKYSWKYIKNNLVFSIQTSHIQFSVLHIWILHNLEWWCSLDLKQSLENNAQHFSKTVIFCSGVKDHSIDVPCHRWWPSSLGIPENSAFHIVFTWRIYI